MQQCISLLVSVLVLAGCSSGTPNQPEFGARIVANGTARVDTAADGTPAVLVAQVRLTNNSVGPLRLIVNLYCPLFVRLYRADSSGAGPVYDGGPLGCTRVGRLIQLAPGSAEVLMRSIPLSELRASGIVAGRYRVEVVVSAVAAQGGPGPFPVQANDVEIP